jgi:hypothetical protein
MPPARTAAKRKSLAGSAKARRQRIAARDLSRSQIIAEKLKRAAGTEDPAHVAGAIVIFATETIQRSANSLLEARGYLDGMRGAIDGLLKNAFKEDAAG